MAIKEFKLHSLFSSVVYQRELSLNIKPIHNYCSKLKKSVKSVSHSNQGGWQSPPITFSELPELSSEIEKYANIFKRTFLFKKPLKISIMWVNINNYKDSNIEHSHPNSILSGVYYVKVPKDSGNLVFLDPRIRRTAKNLKENLLENNSENLSQITHYGLNISDNSLIFFPSYMEHAVHMNKTHNPRITISGNTFVG